MLPARRKPIRFGTERRPKREWPRHRAFVRRFNCCVPGCVAGPIEFAHIRLGAQGNGVGIKPHDAHGISLCSDHHREAHQKGEATFAKKYGIDLQKLAREFAMKSPVPEVREYVRPHA